MDGTENFRAQKYLNSKMKISVLCFALFLSRVLSDRPMKVQVAGHHQCVVNVAESSRKLFNESLESGKKVIFFRIHYDSKQAEALTRPIPDNHFANPNDYMWLYDGDNGLPVYMNAPYDFELLSLFILKEYTSTLIVNMNVSTSCDENIVSRVDFLRLVFHQLIQIVSPAQLPDNRASAYVCYDVNNRKNLPDYSFLAYQRLGMNRAVLNKHCCKVKDINPNYNGTDLCPGGQISPRTILDIQNYIGAFLYAFLPLFFVFISGAELCKYHPRFDYIRSVSNSFHKGEQFTLPLRSTEPCWINEHDERYNIYTLVKWLLCFHCPSVLASRFRRSLAVFLLMSTLVLDFVFQCVFYEDKLKIYLEDNIPIGYRAIFFGFKKSAENTDYFLGGPCVWFSAYVILGLIVINIPDCLCKAIADSTLKQRKTRTFLVKDTKVLELYGSLNLRYDGSLNSRDGDSLNHRDGDSLNSRDGDSLNSRDGDSLNSRDGDNLNPRDDDSLNSRDDGSLNSRDGDSLNSRDGDSLNSRDGDSLNSRDGDNLNPRDDDSLNSRDDGSLNVSNLHDYDLLYAIMKSSMLTALNLSFWCAVVKQWFDNCKSVYNHFNNPRGIYQLIRVVVTLSCAFISVFLCACELLLCIVYYGCPQLEIWKAIPHSYTMKYIWPSIRHKNLGRKILGLMLFLMSLPVYFFLFLFSTYLFLTTFQILSAYVMFTVIALIAKPDAIGYLIITSVFIYFVISIIKSVSETYKSLLEISIKLARCVHKDFVHKRLKEKFIYSELFDKIVERHHPIRYEVAKALTKLALACVFFISCMYSFKNISLNMSAYFKIGVLLITTMIPKLTTVLTETGLDSRWKIEHILETIYNFKKKHVIEMNSVLSPPR